MQSAQLRTLRAPAFPTAFDRWPAVGWWPDAARDLLTGPPATIASEADLASAVFVLPPRPESIHSSRTFTTGTLAGWGLPDLGESLELIVSELSTNALRHGLRLAEPRAQEPIRLSLIRRGRLVACAISDPGSGAPELRHPSALEPGGLGLHIVESLSLRWGYVPIAPHGKIVWAVVTAPDE
ncbi:ATP-binding protein [Microtetraspora sp. NBRC 13810]|uniref:ATP-binding protein n=1 Tax=Microtetraspora sp. NBRC 13810 TaxID=3030990 RepID=UPI0024A1DE6B|nr:ATP-binding protein [Microtetraspora sp. NBRC 13810]GLW10643.1 ATP-binding protein [Microtetraspora sp. NBRC 13810]